MQIYFQLVKENAEEGKVNADLKQNIQKYHSAILSACPNKNLPNIENIGKPALKPIQPMMVPTAAALKMGVGFPLSNISSGRNDSNRVLSSQARQGIKFTFTFKYYQKKNYLILDSTN